MKCKYLNNGHCDLAKSYTNNDTPTTEEICAYCMTCNKPMQINKAVASIALKTLPRPLPENLGFLLEEIRHVPQGPGTELKKLISWFPVSGKGNCQSCKTLERKMNMWGPEMCEIKLPYILKKLKIAAARRKLPYSENLVKILVRKAIKNATKQL